MDLLAELKKIRNKAWGDGNVTIGDEIEKLIIAIITDKWTDNTKQ